MTRRLALALAAFALSAAPARAGWFAAAPLDGPSPAVVQFGDLDLARDGFGAAVWIREDRGVPHVFLSRLVGGIWRTAERVDATVAAGAADPVVAVADKGRLVVAWSTGGAVYGAFADAGALSPPAVLGSPAAAALLAGGKVGAPDADMAIQGTASVVFEAAGDIRAARLRAGAWAPVPGVLDIEPGRAATAPRVALGADGNAVVTWTEATRVWARRIADVAPSVAPQEVSLPGGGADSPDVSSEDDGSFAWVAFRQTIDGVSHALARRLVGSRFEDPATLDAGGAALAPRISINGRGVGIAAVPLAGGDVDLARLERDAFAAPVRAGGPGSVALAATSQHQDAAVAWLGPAGVTARLFPREAPVAEPEAGLGGPAAGTRAALAADGAGDFAAGFQTGRAGAHAVVVAAYDRPPGDARLRTSRAYKRRTRPVFKWKPGADLGGPQSFRVVVDGTEVGRTTRASLRAPAALKEGSHRWQVVSVDTREQATTSKSRPVRVDTTPPALRVRLRRAGPALRVLTSARDKAAGVKAVRVDFGDGSPRVAGTDVTHRYAHRGRRTVQVRVSDRAGNATTRRYSVRIG